MVSIAWKMPEYGKVYTTEILSVVLIYLALVWSSFCLDPQSFKDTLKDLLHLFSKKKKEERRKFIHTRPSIFMRNVYQVGIYTMLTIITGSNLFPLQYNNCNGCSLAPCQPDVRKSERNSENCSNFSKNARFLK